MPITFATLRLCVLALCAFIPLASASAQSDAVDEYLREQMRINHIPAISVAVVRDGKIEKLRSLGVANLEWETAATTDTAFQLASATKPLTGTALMLLVQDGKLALDDPISKYLPDAPEAWRRVTVRHLVAHASGIPDHLGPDAPKSGEAWVRLAATKPLEFEPGSRGSYGIGGYIVLQQIVERVTGMAFSRFMRERVFEPLGMTSTRFDGATNDGPFRVADVVRRRAGLYSWEGDAPRIFWFHFEANAYTAGGLLASAADLATWAAALDSGRLLSNESLRAMWTAAPVGGKPGSFGVGWVVGTYRGRPTVGHSGGPALADVLRFPDEKLTIVVLSNQTAMYPYLAQGIADILLPGSGSATPPTALADSDPALTARLRDLLASMARGEVPESLFAAEARGETLGSVRRFLVPYARSLGRPEDMVLVEERSDNGARSRSYRVRYGAKTVRWSFNLSSDGRVVSFGPTGE